MELRISTTRLLALGIDERVFEKDSFLRENALYYGRQFFSTHILCRSAKPLKAEKVGNVVFHPVFVRSSFLFPIAAFFAGLRIIRENRGAWMVNSDNPFEVGVVSWLLSCFARGKLFLQIHTDVLSPQFRQASWKERIRFWCARFLIPRADCIRAVSERIRRSLVESGLRDAKRIEVLSIATDVKRFSGALPSAPCNEFLKKYSFRMIAVGRLVDKEKNFSMLLDVMKEFVKISPAAFLAIVGYGPDKNRYDSLVKQNRLENNVIIGDEKEMKALVCSGAEKAIERPGTSEGDFLSSFYKSFDVCVISSNYEGWNRVAIEAMAAGLPVVMTDVGCAGEVVRNGEDGIVVPVRDQGALRRALIRLYRNPSLRERMSRHAENTSAGLQFFSREKYLDRYSDILQECARQ